MIEKSRKIRNFFFLKNYCSFTCMEKNLLHKEMSVNVAEMLSHSMN